MSECEGKDCPVEKNVETVEKEIQAATGIPEANVIEMQHVIITLADGRKGVFMGPALIKKIEMDLNTVPKLVAVDFDPPRAVAMPVPREVPTDPVADPVEEIPNADTKTDEQPAAGLE